MDLKQIKELMGAMGRARMKKLSLKQGDFEIELERESQGKGTEQPSVFVHSHPIPPHATVPMHAPVHAPMPAQAVGGVPPQAEEPKVEGKFVSSPMVGTFYKSSSPDSDPFVKVGDAVDEDTVVCIIEAMKVMNEVKAGVKGTVKELLVDDGQAVEFGTNLFQIG